MVLWIKKRETSLVVGRSDELCIRNSSQRGVPQQSLVRLSTSVDSRRSDYLSNGRSEECFQMKINLLSNVIN